MKKIGLFLLLAAGLAFAQQDPQQPSAQGSAAAQASTQQQTDVGKPTDTDQALFKGCVGGSKDNYTLTDEKGQSFRLHSDKDINEHVGNMVEIRGTLKKEGSDRQQVASADAAAQPEIDVADIKDVSKGCSNSPVK